MLGYERARAEINLANIRENLINLKKLVNPDSKALAVIKADGYGHGAVAVAKVIDELVDAYGVAIVEEAIELQKRLLEEEGHVIISKGTKNIKYYVQDFENSLIEL